MAYLLPLLEFIRPFLGWGLLLGVLLAWLRDELTARWVLALFESEGQPSIRLVIAGAVVVFTLCMQAADRLNSEEASINWTFVSSLLLIGSARIAAKAFAARPPEPATQINSKQTDVDAPGATITNAVEQP